MARRVVSSRHSATAAERHFCIDTMCYSYDCDRGGDTSKRAASSGRARPPVREVRILKLLAVLAFAAATELQFLSLYKCAHAAPTCPDYYYSCNKSAQEEVDPLCSCHANCSLYDACCDDVRTNDLRPLPQDSYECAVYPTFTTTDDVIIIGVVPAFVFLITKCPSAYGVPILAKLCSEPRSKIGSTNESLSEQWVTDNITGVTFSNRFCALCYGVPARRMMFWNVTKVNAIDPSLNRFGIFNGKNYAQSPFSSTDLLPKCSGPYYAACPVGTQQAMQEACLNSPARYAIDKVNFRTYRNFNCSICASSEKVNDTYYQCDAYSLSGGTAFTPSVQGILGIDNCPKRIVSFAASDELAEFTQVCPDTFFDSGNCSKTVNVAVLLTSYSQNDALDYYITQQGVRLVYNSSFTLCYKCQPKTIFNYTFLSDNVVQLVSNKTYSKPLFQIESDRSITVCSASPPIDLPSSPCSGLPSEVDVVLMSLSLFGLALYAVAYAMLTSLQNLPGQIVLHQSAAFFAAFLLWLLRAPARFSSDACVALGVLTHFFFLAGFTWTTVYAVEVVRALGFQAYGVAYTKRRRWYTVVGWLVPVVITVIAIAVDWAPQGSVEPRYRPSYGSPQCFINNPTPHRIFFTAPLAVLLLIDVAIYAYIVVQLVIISGQTKMVRENHHEKISLAFKLVFALGMTWIFALLATATENCIIGYIFSVLNSLQGVFVFLIFICNARNLGQIHQKLREPKSITTVALTVSSQRSASSTVSAFPKRKKVLGVNSFSPVSLSMEAQERASQTPPHQV